MAAGVNATTRLHVAPRGGIVPPSEPGGERMHISYHAAQRLAQRGLTVADVNQCVNGGNYFVQPNDNRHYSLVYDNGRSSIHVLTSNDGGTLVTAWIRGRLDPGV